jgi:hypothetical protein
MDYEITKISDSLVHIHEASNYAREALGTNPNHQLGGYQGFQKLEQLVTTLVGDGAFQITVRIKGSLSGYTAKIPLLNGSGSDRVEPHHLKAAVEALKEKIKA